MFDNYDRCSSGLMYVKNHSSLDGLLNFILNFISTYKNFLNEMTALYRYQQAEPEKVQILPTYWQDKTVPEITYSNLNYNDSIFDALAMGCFLLGIDPFHTNGVVTPNLKAHWSLIDYTNQKFEWKVDELGRKKPYVWNGEKWLLINNLHVHSKELKTGLSISII